MNIQDQVAVVTGAAGGIGRATCKELVKRGIRGVAMVDQTPETREVAAAFNDFSGSEVAIPFIGDVTSEEFREGVFTEMRERFGAPVRICVPAAGITRDDLAVKLDKETGEVSLYPLEDFRLVVEVNFIAPVYWAMQTVAAVAAERAAHGLKRWMPEEDLQGAIIFLGSIASVGNKGQISYSSTKAGLEGAAATLMAEAMYYGVRCGVIHPGFTDTPMVRKLGEEFIEKRVLPQTQLKRLLRPSEIAEAICFMVSNAAVSGEIWADAGWRPAT